MLALALVDIQSTAHLVYACAHLYVTQLIGRQAVMGERSDAGREEFLRYYQGSIAVPSTTTARIEHMSHASGVFLVIGVIEREGGTLYCTVIFVHPSGGLVGKHRKLIPTGTERLCWGQGTGATLPVLPSTIGGVEAKVAAAICWVRFSVSRTTLSTDPCRQENYMPLRKF